jgi:hypothetical protein
LSVPVDIFYCGKQKAVPSADGQSFAGHKPLHDGVVQLYRDDHLVTGDYGRNDKAGINIDLRYFGVNTLVLRRLLQAENS